MPFYEISCNLRASQGFSGSSGSKESACNEGDLGLIPGSEKPTPVFLPGEFHWQRSLAGCSPLAGTWEHSSHGITRSEHCKIPVLEMVTMWPLRPKQVSVPSSSPPVSAVSRMGGGDLDTQQARVCHLPPRSLRALKINAKAVHDYVIKTQKWTLWKYLWWKAKASSSSPGVSLWSLMVHTSVRHFCAYWNMCKCNSLRWFHMISIFVPFSNSIYIFSCY